MRLRKFPFAHDTLFHDHENGDEVGGRESHEADTRDDGECDIRGQWQEGEKRCDQET